MNKFVVFSIVALATLGSLAHASVPDPSNYPLRVQIMHTDWHRSSWGAAGIGKGNLQQDGKVQGFDYAFDCTDPFLASEGGERYLARWKTVGSKLSILTHPIGSPNKHSECDLKVTLHSFAFGRQNGQLVTISPQQMNQQAVASAQLQRELNPADTDPTHFPLKVFMLSVDWGAKTAAGYSGSGQANVQDGDQIHNRLQRHCLSCRSSCRQRKAIVPGAPGTARIPELPFLHTRPEIHPSRINANCRRPLEQMFMSSSHQVRLLL